ncbi:uncharacterized protein C19orf44 homolog [Microcaecilia unicolor]|uniref:Uncharacterized protein C19orf44 homolog n=1 Tax=Microcaecilia unicolor TaxID=1415580 RepID=A0A6P7Z817_9AMPH|nr:uncharacterized protein C19orf44 homolog [Microcaecilia unicolor]XP_030073652.1 uncharacterized protein C19orf44 homolog [Microcaecilia unicolor]XP_030073653.1 uncharacterized protein C19orf44 homolog [Microcaecilia unicolor]XP_030073654.1 uncharacterized protein C19orf44 homolog [Microcaecilia unicolor]
MHRSGIRSAALARAQAQLSGQRVPTGPKDSTDELQEYMNTLNKKTSALKQNKISIPGLSDLSDLSVDDSETEKIKRNENLKQEVKETENVGQASPGHSRFLKKKQTVTEKPVSIAGSMIVQEEKQPVAQHSSSKARSSVALRKLAEIESKIMNRKLGPQLSDTDSDLRTSDERPFSVKSSNELNTRGNRFIKKKTYSNEKLASGTNQEWGEKKGIQTKEKATAETKQVQITLESEDEEIRKLIESSMAFSDEDQKWWKLPSPVKPEMESFINNQTKNIPQTPSPPSRGSPHRTVYKSTSVLSLGSLPRATSRVNSRSPSPPSRGSPRRSWRAHSFASRSPSPSVRSSLTSASSPRMKPGGRNGGSSSQQNKIKSLDDLFSKASMTEDLDSENSNDFKMNILSLDDLQPITQADALEATEAEESEEKTEKVAWATMPSEEPKPASQIGKKFPEQPKTVACLKGKHPASDSESPSSRDEETEISEHLNGDSTVSITKEQPSKLDSSTTDGVHSAYSEDFEKSATLSDSESNDYNTSRSDDIVGKSAGKCKKYKDSSLASKRAARPSQPAVRWAEEVRRVTAREAAVQTTDPGFTYHWSNMDGTAVLGPHLGTTYMDPAPIASHVVSPDAVEALTVYSPATLALNDMLRQQLMLVKQFMDISRHLHLSLLQSLEDETYHYITLEETQEYIKCHRSNPTATNILQEVKGTSLPV